MIKRNYIALFSFFLFSFFSFFLFSSHKYTIVLLIPLREMSVSTSSPGITAVEVGDAQTSTKLVMVSGIILLALFAVSPLFDVPK